MVLTLADGLVSAVNAVCDSAAEFPAPSPFLRPRHRVVAQAVASQREMKPFSSVYFKGVSFLACTYLRPGRFFALVPRHYYSAIVQLSVVELLVLSDSTTGVLML